MAGGAPKGLFVTGVGTGVGKTYVAARIVRSLAASGVRVGVYKPAASGCRVRGGVRVAEDAVALWKAAGQPGDLDAVCPQRFAAPLAPHLAARAEGREIDPRLLRSGLDYWRARSELIVVEGAGGLLSPLSDDDYVADLAREFGFPLVIVAANRLGVINETLQTLTAAAVVAQPVQVAGIVLTDTRPPSPEDPSMAGNRRELSDRCAAPILGHLRWQAPTFDGRTDWLALAGGGPTAAE